MNLDASAVVLRPRTVAEVLDLACRFSVGPAVRVYARLGAIVLTPCVVTCLALRHLAHWDWFEVWMVAVALAALAHGPFTVAASRLLFSEKISAIHALKLFLNRLPTYMGSQVGLAISYAVASIPLLLLVPWVWIRNVFVDESCLLEGAGVWPSMQRSARVTAGRGTQAFAIQASLLLARGAFVVAAEWLGYACVDTVLQLGRPFGDLFQQGGSGLALTGFFLAVPFVATARFLAYIDSRTRADGWDIQLRFMAIAASAGLERGRRV